MKQYVCKKIDTCFKSGGVLDSSVWKDIESIVLVRNDGRNLAEAYSTKAKICWDEENLYARLNCRDSYIWATLNGPNQPLWKEEVVEVFIDADGDGRDYVELEVNPLNNVLTLLIPDAKDKGLWQENARFRLNGLKTAVLKGEKNWSVDMTIPFENFKRWAKVPPKDGDVWRLNLYRIDRPIKEKPQECILMAWSPTFQDTFHVPERFGEIIFGARI